MQDWNFSGKGDSMLGQWISNLLARSEPFSQLRLAEVCASGSDCADGMVGPVEEVEGHRQGSSHRWHSSHC